MSMMGTSSGGIIASPGKSPRRSTDRRLPPSRWTDRRLRRSIYDRTLWLPVGHRRAPSRRRLPPVSNEPISVQLFLFTRPFIVSLPCAFVSIWPDCSARGSTHTKKENDHLHLINIHGASTLVSRRCWPSSTFIRLTLTFWPSLLWSRDQGLICIKTTFIANFSWIPSE